MSTKKKPALKPGLFVVIDLSSRCGEHIAKSANPTKIHTTLLSAEEESARLASANVGKLFGVFSCTGLCQADAPVAKWRQPTKDDITPEENIF